jgi:pyridoxine 4-dehydrogenase
VTNSAPTSTATTAPASGSGTLTLGEDLTVTRLGYGAMRITGEGIWGEPQDREAAKAVLRRAVELGVDLIDTADSYGPFVSEDLIREALHTGDASDPYGGVTIATKGGLTRTGPDGWHAVGRPEYLRQCVEMSLRRLDLETIPLYQLHRIDPEVPVAEQLGALDDLRQQGKIRHLGLSEVSVAQLREAQQHTTIVSVQNRFNLLDRGSQDVLDVCTADGLGFIPWFPVATGDLTRSGGPLDDLVEATGAAPSQVALAWLLRTSPVVLPIPGTSSIAHLEENVGAAGVELTDAQMATLDAAA